LSKLDWEPAWLVRSLGLLFAGSKGAGVAVGAAAWFRALFSFTGNKLDTCFEIWAGALQAASVKKVRMTSIEIDRFAFFMAFS
jgi:hypothetical protein